MVKFGKLTKIDLYFFYYVNYSGFCIWNFLVCKMDTPLLRTQAKCAAQLVAYSRKYYASLQRTEAQLWRIYGGTSTITTKVCARPPDAPVPEAPNIQDQADLRTPSSTLYDLRNPKFLRGITVDTDRINTLAHTCAGPSYPRANIIELINLLRKIGILGSNETVVPFSLVEDERVVPYPDNLVTIALQVINNEGGAINYNIYIFEIFEVSRVKV